MRRCDREYKGKSEFTFLTAMFEGPIIHACGMTHACTRASPRYGCILWNHSWMTHFTWSHFPHLTRTHTHTRTHTMSMNDVQCIIFDIKSWAAAPPFLCFYIVNNEISAVIFASVFNWLLYKRWYKARPQQGLRSYCCILTFFLFSSLVLIMLPCKYNSLCTNN